MFRYRFHADFLVSRDQFGTIFHLSRHCRIFIGRYVKICKYFVEGVKYFKMETAEISQIAVRRFSTHTTAIRFDN